MFRSSSRPEGAAIYQPRAQRSAALGTNHDTNRRSSPKHTINPPRRRDRNWPAAVLPGPYGPATAEAACMQAANVAPHVRAVNQFGYSRCRWVPLAGRDLAAKIAVPFVPQQDVYGGKMPPPLSPDI